MKLGQVYINNHKLDTFYGKEYNTDGYIDGTNKAHTHQSIEIPEDHYYLAGDVWWRAGLHDDAFAKGEIRGKVIGWLGEGN